MLGLGSEFTLSLGSRFMLGLNYVCVGFVLGLIVSVGLTLNYG